MTKSTEALKTTAQQLNSAADRLLDSIAKFRAAEKVKP